MLYEDPSVVFFLQRTLVQNNKNQGTRQTGEEV